MVSAPRFDPRPRLLIINECSFSPFSFFSFFYIFCFFFHFLLLKTNIPSKKTLQKVHGIEPAFQMDNVGQALMLFHRATDKY
jgi:hypothetical protein